MQHALSTLLTYPGSCKNCFSRIPDFGRKISLIFSIIYQIVDQNLNLWSLPTIPWMSLWGLLFQFHSQLALKFHWDKTCLYFELLLTLSTLKLHWNYSISHAKTSLLVNCAGGTQGVQLLDWSNKGQVQAIRLRWVRVTWYPSIWCWSLWIG